MKKTLKQVSILLAILLTLVAANSYAQDNIVINTLKNGSLEEVKNIVMFSSQINNKIGEYEANYLYYAAYNSDEKVIKYLIEDGGDVNFKSKHGETPLMIATAFNDNIDLIKLLINSGANINQSNNSGYTPILYSAINSNIDVIKLLVSNGANLFDKTKSENNALHIAAVNNPNSNMIKYLVKNGLDLFSEDYLGQIPFEKAVMNNNFDVFRTFLVLDKNLIFYENEYKNNVLYFSAYNENKEILDVLINSEKQLFDINSRNDLGYTYLWPAVIYNENIEVMKLLINQGVNISARDYKGQTVLMALVQSYDEKDIVKRIEILIKNGADMNAVNKYEDNILDIALNFNNLEVVKYFWNNKLRYSTNEINELFFEAVTNENLEVVKFIFGKEPDINSRNHFEETPLMKAALLNSNPEVIDFLLKNGANPKLIDNDGKTAYDHMKDNFFLDGSNTHWKLHDLKF